VESHIGFLGLAQGDAALGEQAGLVVGGDGVQAGLHVQAEHAFAQHVGRTQQLVDGVAQASQSQAVVLASDLLQCFVQQFVQRDASVDSELAFQLLFVSQSWYVCHF